LTCFNLFVHSSHVYSSQQKKKFFWLDGALSNLVLWKVSLPMAGGLKLDDL